MLEIVTKSTLVVIAGVHTMRATDVIFYPQPFQPLMAVAAFALVMLIVFFYLTPRVPDPWLYISIALCLVGIVANAFLYFASDAAHGTPANLAFSAVSVVGWTTLVFAYASLPVTALKSAT